MPSNWLYLDTNFPTFTGGESNTEKINTIQNYMYMLVEQLRYSMRNMSPVNFNTAGLQQLGNILTEPLTVRLEGAEGQISDFRVTLDGVTITDENGTTWIKGSTIHTGSIYFDALDSSTRSTINGAASAASSAASLARRIANGEFAGGTFINNREIYSPTIYANEFNVVPEDRSDFTGAFNIYGIWAKAQDTLYHMLSIKYSGVEDAPIVRIYSPSGAYLEFGDTEHVNLFRFQGRYYFGTHASGEKNCTVDFSMANVTGLTIS